jgi:hypothetical protein
LTLDVTAPAEGNAGVTSLTFESAAGKSAPLILAFNRFTAIPESGTSDSARTGQAVKLPASIVGAIDRAGDADFFRFEAKPGDQIGVQVIASELGSKLDPVIVLTDTAGIVLAEGTTSLGFVVAKPGTYALGIRDLEYRGGSDFTYRLHAGDVPVVTGVFPLAVPRGRTLDIHLDGVVSYGGKSASVSYQMWFTEHHPDMFTIGPTERWLEHTVLRFSHDMANTREFYTGISGCFLREFAMQAIHDHLWREAESRLGHEVHQYIYPILDAILGISKTREEQAWPSGQLVFIEPQQLSSIRFLARFKANEQPRINHHKHVRKLLQVVSRSDRKLISDGDSILGIAEGPIPKLCLVAEFHGRIGFFKFNGEEVCSFADGRFGNAASAALASPRPIDAATSPGVASSWIGCCSEA